VEPGGTDEAARKKPNTVPTLIAADAIPTGTTLTINLDLNEHGTPTAHTLTRETRDLIATWIAENPRRGQATWTPQAQCLTWAADGQTYTPTGLAQHIYKTVTGQKRAINGSRWWHTPDGHTLTQLADLVRGL